MSDKTVFKLKEVDGQKMAESLGLITMPEIDFGPDDGAQITNTMSRQEQRTIRIRMLKEQAKKRKEEKQKEKLKEIWKDVSEGSNLDGEESSQKDSDGESEDDNDDSKAVLDSSESDNEDYLVKVDKSKQTFKFEDEDSEVGNDLKMTRTVKKKMKKITTGGHFEGKNKQLLGPDGKALTSIEALREKNRVDGSGLDILDEEDALKLKPKANYLDNVKSKLLENTKVDEQKHKEKLKANRLKKKRGLKEREGNYQQDGGAEVASAS